MIEKVRSCMEKYGMLPENGNIVAGVSGGADSVCLLRVLVALRDRYRLNLTAVHVNHRIRQEAGQDADFVKRLCEAWEVEFVLVEEDVEALAAREHLSCEEAGRKVRYEAFEQALAQMNAERLAEGGSRATAGAEEGREAAAGLGTAPSGGCIAVAHNSDDRAETLLFHMFRGTGLNGMGSIRPVRELENGDRIIRPLLFCTRDEIETFLRRENLSWCTDATNSEEVYTRNKIRNRVLPYAQQEICEKTKEHLSREAQLLSETADFVGRMTREAMERCSHREKDGSLVFETEVFLKEDLFLQQQMVMAGLSETGTGKDLTAAHVEQVSRLFAADCQSGKKMEIPACRVYVRRQFSQVVMQPVDGQRRREMDPHLGAVGELCGVRETFGENGASGAVFLREGSQLVPGLGEILVDIFDISEKTDEKQAEEGGFLQDIPEKKYTKWFDYDKITESVVVRFRRTGDYLTINNAGARKSLKRYLIEEKIPADRRDELLLLADGAHVMWVPGHRISAAYKVTAQTKRILQVYLTGGKEDGREN